MVSFSTFTCIPLLLMIFQVVSSGEAHEKYLPNPPRPIRLILSDLEGTLTTSDGAFVRKNVEGFQLARRLGIQVLFATGRDLEKLQRLIGEDILEELGYFGVPGVYNNGAFVLNSDGVVIQDAPLSDELLDRIVQAFKSSGLENIVYGEVTNSNTDQGRGAASKPRYYTVYTFDDPNLIDRAQPHLEEQFREELEFSRWVPHAFGVHRRGFSKGSGLIALAADMGISPEEVLVLGDAVNDLPMFEVAGTAVAVGNAAEAAKKAADYVTVDSSEGALLAVVKEIQRLGYYPGAPPQAAETE